jgi:hypothetical protein
MQAKDIPEAPIMEFLGKLAPYQAAGWHNLTPREGCCPTVIDAMPPGTPQKVALAKMRALIKRGLIDGCACGCRGDFTLKGQLMKDYQSSAEGK